jgi:hypothetical protein
MSSSTIHEMRLNQHMVYPGAHETLQTSTTPVVSQQIGSRYIMIASGGDDHLVDFGETPGATMASALVPRGTMLLFNTESLIATDGNFQISVRAASGAGIVTIYYGAE